MIKKLLCAIAALITTCNLLAQPAIIISPGNSCFLSTSANIGTVTAMSIASSYSWSVSGPACAGSILSANGSSAAVVQYNCCGMQTITCVGYSLTTPLWTVSANVNQYCPPSVSIAPVGNPVCAGTAVTLAPFGAISYSWASGATTASIVVIPVANTCYTVYGADPMGCISMASTCLSVMPVPSISVTQFPQPLCSGTSTVLTGCCANSYTWLPQNATGASINIWPTSNTCYTLIGAAGSCTSSAVTCVAVLPLPSLNVTGGGTVCLGSSATLNVSGANTYTWVSPPSNATTINVIPTTGTSYMVWGTGTNGCSDSLVTWVQPINTCAMVWPGDANSDGIVNTTDVLELGVYASNTGPGRTPGGNTYIAQFATVWGASGSNSQDQSHIDCNGDGVVNASDTLAIYNNFGLSHAFRQQSSGASGDITLVGPGIVSNQGHWATVDIVLGSQANNLNNIYGVAFDINLDNSLIDNNQVYVRYTASFLNAGNQNIIFRRITPGSGQANCATVRVDGNNVSGNGKIGELWFMPGQGKTGTMQISVSNAKKTDANGQLTDISGSVIGIELVSTIGINENVGSLNAAGFYPNPASTELVLWSTDTESANYIISDISGRTILIGTFSGKTTIGTSSLHSGVYFIALESDNKKTIQKLIIKN